MNRLNVLRRGCRNKKMLRKKYVLENKEKPWMRVYDFGIMRRIRKLRKDNEKRNYVLKNVKLMREDQFKVQKCEYPVKIKLKFPLQISMPKKVQATVHQQSKMDYEGYNKFLLVSIPQMIGFSQPNAKISVPQMQLSNQNIQIPPFALQYFDSIHKINLWMYMGKRISDWHYDGHDNFLVMALGYKILYLAHPKDLKSREVYSLFNNHAMKPISPVKSSNSHKLTIFRVVVGPQECIFIPRGWWHKVISIGNPSVGVNFWGNSLVEILKISRQDKKMLLKQLLFEQVEQKCEQNIKIWEELPEGQKQAIRKKVASVLLTEGFS